MGLVNLVQGGRAGLQEHLLPPRPLEILLNHLPAFHLRDPLGHLVPHPLNHPFLVAQEALVVPNRAVPVGPQEALVVPNRAVPVGLRVEPGAPCRAVPAVCFHHRFRHSFQFLQSQRVG